MLANCLYVCMCMYDLYIYVYRVTDVEYKCMSIIKALPMYRCSHLKIPGGQKMARAH